MTHGTPDPQRPTLTPWTTLTLTRASGARITGDVERRRTLAAWREGRGPTGLTIMCEGVDVAPREVDWTGLVVPAGRRGGEATPDTERPGERLTLRVDEGVPDALAGLAARTGQTRGALVSRLVRAEVERLGTGE